ncbi:MAG: sugar phosphate isomerase/epimerase family protein [Bacteroidota bacterium]
MKTRRRFLQKSATGIAGITLASLPQIVQATTTEKNREWVHAKVKLGVASYSLREFSMEKALDMTLRCGIQRITFKSMHLPLDSDSKTITEAVDLCRKKGVILYGAGVVYMKNREEIDQAFFYAKTAKLEMIVGVPNHELLDYVEEMVKQTNIKLAIHNHGPGDKLYSSPEDAYNKVIGRDPRMGLCLDIGHVKRIGRDPSKDVKAFAGRIFDIHLKDVTTAKADGKTCIIGRGTIDFKTFLKTIKKIDYQGTLALEYEAEGKDPLPGMAESIGYVKGILATL